MIQEWTFDHTSYLISAIDHIL